MTTLLNYRETVAFYPTSETEARFCGRWRARVLVLQYVLGKPAGTLCGAVMVIPRPNLPAAVLSQGESQGEGARRRHRTDWRSRRPSRCPSTHHIPQRMRAGECDRSAAAQMPTECRLSSASPLQPCVRSTLRLETQFIETSRVRGSRPVPSRPLFWTLWTPGPLDPSGTPGPSGPPGWTPGPSGPSSVG